MKNERRLWWLSVLFASAVVPAACMDELESPIKSDEEVVFFPTCGHLAPDGKAWLLEVHGWIYEPIQESMSRSVALSALRRALGLEKGDAETEIFVRRAGLFLTDNERGKRIPIRIGGRVVELRASRANGHFEDVVEIPVAEIERALGPQGAAETWLAYAAIVRSGDSRSFAGRIQLVRDSGLSVVSDIDDTIKTTGVADPRALVQNTFLRDYEAVPGMADLYRKLERDGAQFHYVSNSPWQLYAPLSRFFEAQGFPRGTYHMRLFRLKDSSIVRFLAAPEDHKRSTLERLLVQFPRRRFILVGDTGERDPEIYGDIGRRYSGQVERILLRDPAGTGTVTPRLREALREIPEEKWRVFADAGELEL